MSAAVVRLGIRVRAARAETALADLLPLLGAGAEEREVGGAIEYAIYLPEGELPPVETIRGLAGDALLRCVVEPVAADWERRFHAHLRRVEVGGLAIRPPWVDGPPGDLVIDPGTTFGAGGHESSRLALALLQDRAPGGPLCDWGAGSGVLAVAAARLGWEPVTAIELDPAAAAVIDANAERNAVRVHTRAADLRRAAWAVSDRGSTPRNRPPSSRDVIPWAPTVVANLPADLHRAVAARLERSPEGGCAASPDAALWHERLPEGLIASGFLTRRADEVAALYAPLREIGRRVEGEWAAVVLA